MTNIRRYGLNGAPVFITAVTTSREPFLQLPQNKELLLAVIREVKAEHAFQMLGYVILNDHLHLLIKPQEISISKTMQSIKLRFTKRIAGLKPGDTKLPTSCWQRRFWDHIIRDQDDLQRHLDYIHYNPVKHGLAKSPSDYAYSSFQVYVEKGAYNLAWGAEEIPTKINGMEFE